MPEQVATGHALQASDPRRLGDLALLRRLKDSSEPMSELGKPMPFLAVPAQAGEREFFVVKAAPLPLDAVATRCLDEEHAWASASDRLHVRDSDGTYAWVARSYVVGVPMHRIDQHTTDGLKLAYAVWLLEELHRWHHDHGEAHLDVKPSNVVLTEQAAVLIDFESSRHVSQDAPSFGMGTPRFASPEQITGRLDEVGAASDVFSWALTVCWLFNRHRHPYAGMDASRDRLLELDAAVRRGGAVPDLDLPAIASPTLTEAVRAALSWTPSARPSAGRLLDMIQPTSTEVMHTTMVLDRTPLDRVAMPHEATGRFDWLGPRGMLGDATLDRYAWLVGVVCSVALGGLTGLLLAVLVAKGLGL